MAKLTMILLAIVVCMAAIASHADGARLSCRMVVDRLLPCKDYLRKGGSVPGSCCNGVRTLNREANNSADRKTACGCMKLMARAYRVNPRFAAYVPYKCRVNVGSAISFNTDCNRV